MKRSKEQRAAWREAIDAVFALSNVEDGATRDETQRICDELLTLRYGPTVTPAASSPLRPA
jgi:hypothetical protein